MIPTDPAQTAATATTDVNADAIVMYSTTWCGDCRRAKRVFADYGVDYTEINIEEDEDAAELVQTLNNGMRSVPTILFHDGSILVEPSNATLAAKLEHLASATR